MGMRWIGSANRQDREGAEVVVNMTTRAQLLADLQQRLETKQGFSVATLNLDHVVKLRKLPRFRLAYIRHSHVTADGNPIVWFSRLAGEPVSLLPGSELIFPAITCAMSAQVPVALFGSTPETLTLTKASLLARFPDLQIAATLSPPMEFDPEGPDADRYISDLGASGAGLVFLALGAPKQEIFAERASAALPGIGFMSIGAGLDFISGQQVRAPKIVRRFAAEWLWRLARDPRRLLGRYAACAAVMPSLFVSALKARHAAQQKIA